MSVIDEIAAERRRQVEEEGFDARHDDQHGDGAMARAAAAYAAHSARFDGAEALGGKYQIKAPPGEWPWAWRWWRPKDPRRDLIRAGALIVAEIERRDRATLKAQEAAPPSDQAGRKLGPACWTSPGGCSSCKHCGMDMDLDPYCAHPVVIKVHPYGLGINAAIRDFCTPFLRLREARGGDDAG